MLQQSRDTKLSIVTVVYNSKSLIENTIISVSEQTYSNIEYIVIDGASNDGTLDVLQKHTSKIDKFISEKDKGIYDAMNKGISLSTGDYILFLNAGDFLFAKDTIEMVFKNSAPFADVYYGETEIVDEKGNSKGTRRLTTPGKLTWKSLKYGMCVSHQSFIAKKSIVPFYDLSYKISADIEWVIETLKRSKKVVNTNLFISKYLEGGKSRENTILALKERFKIMVKHYGLMSVIKNHIYISAKFLAYVIKNRKIN